MQIRFFCDLCIIFMSIKMRRENQGYRAGKAGSSPRGRSSRSGERSFKRGSAGFSRNESTGFQGGEIRFSGSRTGDTGRKQAISRQRKPDGMLDAGKAPGRRRTIGEQRAEAYLRSTENRSPEKSSSGKSGKKLVLRGEKRPSRSQLLRELGHTSEKQVSRHTVEKQELTRLNRFIANAGICSRREADTYITAGVVKVNGQIVTELGTKVSPDDDVRFDDRRITPERKVYLLLNKPKDVVTTTDDPHADYTVMDLIKGACEERIYPVGRLDRNTTGLLLLTNDGELSKRLTHPSHKVEKVYQVTLDNNVSVNDIQKIAAGVQLDDGFIAADAITYVEGQNKNVVGIEIHSGKNRVVRRIFELLGYKVKALDRVSFAGLTKKNIPRGKWRFLSPREVSYLKMQ
jgi:23S rRNA pseudouridine2605 synthase